MEQISFKDKKAIFDRLEKMAKKANMTPEERRQYEEEWKIYNDYFNTIESAEKKGYIDGIEEGREEGRAEGELNALRKTAQTMKMEGLDIQLISRITGLTIEEIEKL